MKIWLVESLEQLERHIFKNKEDALQFIKESEWAQNHYQISECEVIE